MVLICSCCAGGSCCGTGPRPCIPVPGKAGKFNPLCPGSVTLIERAFTQNVFSVQLYLPRIPGVPNDFAYLPDRFGFEYEVRVESSTSLCKRHDHCCKSLLMLKLSISWLWKLTANAQDVYMTTKDGIKLHSWMMWPKGWSKQKRRARPLVLFFQARSQGHLLAWPAAHALTTVDHLAATCSGIADNNRCGLQENAGNMSFRLPFLRLVAHHLHCAIFAPRYVDQYDTTSFSTSKTHSTSICRDQG